MHEITTTRSNHLIDPIFHAWGWEIPVYLFLGGMVAVMMIISGYFLFIGRVDHFLSSCLEMARKGRAKDFVITQAIGLVFLKRSRAK